jgi:PAS domain S-box-containing protein
MSWPDVWRQYWPWLGAIATLIAALLGALLLLRGRQQAVVRVSGQNRLLLASAGEGICGIDIDGITTFVNPAATKMLGYSAGELIGRNLHDLTHHTKPDGQPYPGHECPVCMARIDGAVYRGSDDFFYRKDGGAIPVSCSSRPIIDAGRFRGAVICFQDITRRKQIEEELQHVNETLEQRVAQAVEKNMEQERMLIRQNRLAAMGEMIGNIAHQWRQPLNALGLVLFNIKDAFQFNTLNADFLDQAVADGSRMVQKMSATISDFSNFFRPDKEIMNFSALRQIREAVSLVASSFQNSNISIHIDAPRDIKLLGFPNEYSQVLLNLLSNAREAILACEEPLSGRVDIGLTERNGQGCVMVRDNGGGIPAESLDRIFDPYFSTKESGTGIGLYMSKMIIERNMNGSITATNIEGGAEFSVCAPLAKETGKGATD